MALRYYLVFLFVVLAVCCRETYIPPAISTPNNFLVVDGFINAGSDSTIIKLTRTRNLGSNADFIKESGALLTINGKSGDIHPLQEITAGVYAAAGLNLNPSGEYQLRIATSGGKVYLSDFVPVLQTPAVDSITWQQGSDGISIFVNTHDPSGRTNYYRWEFEETWEYHSMYFTPLIYSGGQVIDRLPADYINACWLTRPSTTILLANASGLSQDIIYQAPLNFIPEGDVRLSFEYSILVRQYAITQDAFTFWQNLGKNTENRGSLFDAQPSQTIGNIHCTTDPSEPVVGYISANTVAQARIFIARPQSPPWPYNLTGCDTLAVPLSPDSLALYFNNELFIPVAKHYSWSILLGYFAFPGACVDCRLSGGVNVKPSFWP